MDGRLGRRRTGKGSGAARRPVPEQRRARGATADDLVTGADSGEAADRARDNRRSRHAGRGTVSVIIPTLNEAENIGWALSRLPEDLHEVILVDGRSVDGTVDVALRARPGLRVVLETRPGKGAALRAGFEAATGDYVVMIDADGSMHPDEIALYTAYLDAGFDFVKGSRFMLAGGTDDMTWIRRAGHWPLLAFVRWTFQVRFTDLCYGFCAFRRSCLPALRLTADGFEIESELVLRAVRLGLHMAEVPSQELPRLHGESNLHAVRDGLRISRVLLRERFAGRKHPVGAVDGAHLVIDLVDRSQRRASEDGRDEEPASAVGSA